MKVYILSAAQISLQKPLCDEWLKEPVYPSTALNLSQDPDFKPYISSIASRRLGNLVKRAFATSANALQDAEMSQVDAIITGTGLGCLSHSEHFLIEMIENDEKCLSPTFFMQSTHNTISAQLALHLGCHGYNCTYSQLDISLDSALFDALCQLRAGKIQTALLGGYDEMTPTFFARLDKVQHWKKGTIDKDVLRCADTFGTISGETATSFILSTQPTDNALCYIQGVQLLYKPSQERIEEAVNKLVNDAGLSVADLDAIVIGANGDIQNDRAYRDFYEKWFPDTSILWYKHLFGESYSATGICLYVAATCLHRQIIPDSLLYLSKRPRHIRHILLYNHCLQGEQSLILISK